MKRFTTWIQGWTTWFGYISLLASIANGSIVILESIISLNYDTYEAGGWHTSVLVICLVFVQAVVNIYAFKMVVWFELLDGILHCVLFVVFIVVLSAIGTWNGPEFFLSTSILSGFADQPFVAWNVGMLSCIWIFTGTFFPHPSIHRGMVHLRLIIFDTIPHRIRQCHPHERRDAWGKERCTSRHVLVHRHERHHELRHGHSPPGRHGYC